MKRVLGSLVMRTGTGVSRFPIVILLIALASLAANLEMADGLDLGDTSFLRLEAALFAGALGAIAGALVFEVRGYGLVIRYIVQTAAAGLFSLAVWFGLEWAIYPPALIFGLVFAVPLAPFVGRGDADVFWTFSLSIIVGILLAFTAVLVFVLGLLAIIEMVAFLFDVDAGSGLQRHILTTGFTLIGPLFALGRIPARFDERIRVDEGHQFVRSVALLAGWVSAPLILVSGIVLHLYGLKILGTGDVPRGEIGWIVSVFVVLTLSLRVVCEPIRTLGGKALALFDRIWPYTLVLPLALLAYAAWLRIESEGFTIERYYLALLVLTGTIIAGMAIAVPRRAGARFIVGVPVGLAILSSFGPQGVVDTVGRSQSIRLEAILPSDAGDETDNAGELDPAQKAEARSRIYALAQVDQLDRVSRFADDPASPGRSAYDRANALIDRLSLRAGPARSVDRTVVFERQGDSLDIAGYDRLAMSLVFSTFSDTSAGLVTGRLQGTVLVLRIGTQEARFVLDPEVFDALGSYPGKASAARPSIILRASGRTIGIVPSKAIFDGTGRLIELSGDVLFRNAEWGQ
ncbi:DUF4153 domain-containing protein [Fulvimarina endophytica]|uniref:DUF4153 domain-containing protein n=1 Tax=Fulvimarina endophytica TaxID=2293836 RepID=UPI0013144C9A|nr:DUF4153 domain-containing protein [Fulvimarina endophytica]